VAITIGMLHVEDHRRKIIGFGHAFARFCKGGKVVEIVEDHEDIKEARRKCLSLLDRFPSLAGVYVSTANCLPLCEALHATGRSGKVRLITTDLSREMAPYIKNGTIAASIYQRPHVQGELTIRLAIDRLVNGIPIPPSYYLTPQIVLASNLGLFREVSPPRRVAPIELFEETPVRRESLEAGGYLETCPEVPSERRFNRET